MSRAGGSPAIFEHGSKRPHEVGEIHATMIMAPSMGGGDHLPRPAKTRQFRVTQRAEARGF